MFPKIKRIGLDFRGDPAEDPRSDAGPVVRARL
jgi:hypothetical protein